MLNSSDSKITVSVSFATLTPILKSVWVGYTRKLSAVSYACPLQLIYIPQDFSRVVRQPFRLYFAHGKSPYDA